MTGDGIARRDDIDEITLILSENKKINTLIDEMYIDKKGTEISTVTLVYPKMTLADAATISKRILNDFDYETSTLEEWMKTISDTEATGPSFQHHYQTQSTSLSIDIRYSYNDSNPWRLRVEIYLKKK